MRDLAMQEFIKRIEHRFVPYFADGHGAVKVAFTMQTMRMSGPPRHLAGRQAVVKTQPDPRVISDQRNFLTACPFLARL